MKNNKKELYVYKEKKEDNKEYKLYKPKMFINQIIKRDIMVYTVLAISLVMLTLTSSYAFVSTELNTVQLDNVVSATVEGITLNNSAINLSSVIPSSETDAVNSLSNAEKCKDSNGNTICTLYEFIIKNDGDTARKLTYSLDSISNSFSNLRFKLYNNSKDSVNSSSSVLMTSDKLKKNVTKLPLTGLPTNIKSGDTLTITMLFWIDKIEEDQTIMDASKSFSATLLVDLETTGYAG